MDGPWFAMFAALAGAGALCLAAATLARLLLRRRGVEMLRTRFGLTLVFDSADASGTPVRLLNVGGTFQSVSYVPKELRFELACEYHREMARQIEAMACARGTAPSRPLRVLVMGGGGYSLPKYLAAHVPAAHVEVVEVDEAVTRIARERFFLDECLETTRACAEGRMLLVSGDAWAYLQDARDPFDAIVNDAFAGGRSLRPARSAEGARIVRSHLSDDGVYLANIRCPLEGIRSAPLREAKVAFADVFTDVRVVPEWDDQKKPGCNVLIARA